MAAGVLRLEDLARVLREAAGVEEGVEIDVAALDADFADLGYDSLALMEATARIERHYGLRLGDDAEARTPRELIDRVNAGLAGAGRGPTGGEGDA